MSLAETQRRPGPIELSVLVVVLILFTGGLVSRLFDPVGDGTGSAVLRALWLPVYGLAFVACLVRIKTVSYSLLKLPFLTALTLLATFSFFWSIDPSLSLRRGIAIAMTTLAGVYIGSEYDWKTLLRALGIAWAIIAVVAFLTAIGLPSMGVDNEVHAGAWKGLYYEKNQLGGHMARVAFLMAFLALMDTKWRKLWIGVTLLAAFLVLMSTSKTALLGMMLGLGLLAISVWMKRSVVNTLAVSWIGVVVVGGFAALITLAPELLVQMLGRDLTLTGRTDIWVNLVSTINEKPWLGYGYGAFWAPDSDPAYFVRITLQWAAPTAHNGWFEVALGVGLIGLALHALDLLQTFYRALRSSLDTWMGIFAIGVILQFLLFNLTESVSLEQNGIAWVTYVIVATKLANRPRQLKPNTITSPIRTLKRQNSGSL